MYKLKMSTAYKRSPGQQITASDFLNGDRHLYSQKSSSSVLSSALQIAMHSLMVGL